MVERLVLLYGYPGVGKSTVGPVIADRLGIPRWTKDAIKESLWDALAKPESLSAVDWSRQLGAAAYEVLWAVARDLGPRLMIEAPLDHTFSAPRIRRICREPIEIFVYVTSRSRLRAPSHA